MAEKTGNGRVDGVYRYIFLTGERTAGAGRGAEGDRLEG